MDASLIATSEFEKKGYVHEQATASPQERTTTQNNDTVNPSSKEEYYNLALLEGRVSRRQKKHRISSSWDPSTSRNLHTQINSQSSTVTDSGEKKIEVAEIDRTPVINEISKVGKERLRGETSSSSIVNHTTFSVKERFWGDSSSPLIVYHTTLSPSYDKESPNNLTDFKDGIYYCVFNQSLLGKIQISNNHDREKHKLAQWRVGHYFSMERLPKTTKKKSDEKDSHESIARKFDIYEPCKGAFKNLQNIQALAALCYISQKKAIAVDVTEQSFGQQLEPSNIATQPNSRRNSESTHWDS